ncbi:MULTISPECIES: hypothetical protein [Burkholderia]|uniref:hypothetical protein n=1 Tax=Burkholderia TaxID=32008 RepID=UPI001E567944|nr:MULTISPECIES: hypothetical protein [Burkholderia]
MLRRVVKDHSDIKNPAMMRRADSVWYLKENRIIRERCALSAMPHRIFYFSRTTQKPFLHRRSAFKAFGSTGLFFHFYYRQSIGTMQRHTHVILQFDSLPSFFNYRIDVHCVIHKIPVRLILRGIIYPIFEWISRTGATYGIAARRACRKNSNPRHFPPPGSAISISTGS